MRASTPRQPMSPSAPIDLRRPLTRREALNLLGSAAGAALVVGCGGAAMDADPVTSTTSAVTGGTTSTTTTGSCTKVAEETNGPFPSDGTNTDSGVTKNVLTDARTMRTDIRTDLDGSNLQTGTPLTITMTLLNLNNSCAKLANYYVYVWHCNRTGNYSQYSGSMNGGDFSDRTFLRGIGKTDANGVVSFTTIFPGRYAGRATHIHYEIYPDSTPEHSEVKGTSQLAFPAAITDQVYTNTTMYPSSASNNTSNERDNVFSDGTSTELLTLTGDNTNGYVGTITVAIAA